LKFSSTAVLWVTVALGTLTPHLAFGPFTFDPNSRLLRRREEVVALPPRVLAVLELLLEHAGEVVRKQELIDSVWRDAFVTDTSLAEAISFLRQTLGDDPQTPTYIQTVHRRGYRFVAPVTPLPSVAPEMPRLEELPRSRTPVSPSIAKQLVPWSIATICAAAAIAAVWQVARRPAPAPAVIRFELTSVQGTHFDRRAPALAVSPDGSRVAWSGCDEVNCRLYVRPMDRLDAAALPGTDDAAAPFFSPDGKWIGYFADGKLRKIALAGGASAPLADAADAFGGVWTAWGEIVFAGARSGLSIVSDDGRNLRALTAPIAADGEVRHAWPSIARDGRTLLFSVLTAPADETPPRLAAMSLGSEGDEAGWKTILDGAGRAHAVSHEALVFSRGSELAAIAFDATRLAVSGTPHTILTDVPAARHGGHFGSSASGSFVYARRDADSQQPAKQSFASSVLSPDGSRVAASITDGIRSDIWIAALATGAATRLTHDGVNIAPVWHPDGSAVYFSKRGGERYEVWKRDAAAGAPPTRVFAANSHVIPLSVSADATTLLVLRAEADTGLDVWAVPTGGAAAHPLVQTAFDETGARISPDGRFVAYQSNESGRWEIYVMRLADGRRTVVSARGGVDPLWESEGLRIRYEERHRPMLATITAAPDLQVSLSTALPDARRRVPTGLDAAGRFQFATEARASRAVVTLSFDRVVRELVGPPAGAMPR
jgi:DNA-binding winged helix-turn-helix (wHTH) protein/Tol biopolymer transport system component